MPKRLLVTSLVALMFGCSRGPEIGPGVSLDLAEHRAREIHDVNYDVRLAIPADQAEPIVGHIAIAFVLESEARVVVVDFTAPLENVHGVTVNGDPAEYSVQDGHIVIPRRSDQLLDGENVVGVDFTAGDGSLNRQSDFLYTLFVPDRASSAVPLFDQPDLKATFRLALQVPTEWEAVANAPVATADTAGTTKTIRSPPRVPSPRICLPSLPGGSRWSRRNVTVGRCSSITGKPTRRVWRATSTRSSTFTRPR